MKAKGRPLSFDRDQVLEKALRLFWSHGYENVSTDLICRECGLSKPSLYNSFGTKEEFFIECFNTYNQKYVSALFEVLYSQDDPIVGVENLLRAASAQFQSPDFPRGCLAITGLIEVIGKSAPIDAQLKEIQTGFVEAFEEYFEGRRSPTQKLPPKDIALYVIGQLYALAVFSRSNKELFQFENFVQMSKLSLQNFL